MGPAGALSFAKIGLMKKNFGPLAATVSMICSLRVLRVVVFLGLLLATAFFALRVRFFFEPSFSGNII